MTTTRRSLTGLLAAATFALLLALVPTPAEAGCGMTGCASTTAARQSSLSGTGSTGTTTGGYDNGQTSCSVYANGTGMGSYCWRYGAVSRTLAERFPGQTFQACRWDDIPRLITPPVNRNPDKGRYMLRSCLRGVDFDTVTGGRDKTVSIEVVFVDWNHDVDDVENGLSEYLWNRVEQDTLLPVPFMETHPNQTPIVGVPTFFTFRWLDPNDNSIVHEGPYEDDPDGGPYKQIVTGNAVRMVARADKIVIDPRQKGMEPVTCDPHPQYTQGADANDQPASACKLTFTRSSASARELTTDPIPNGLGDVFYADVKVTWHVSYGNADGSNMRQLGDDFTMSLKQAIPVQEVQAPNQPPAVIY